MRIALMICWGALLAGCGTGLTEWDGRDPNKSVIWETKEPQKYGMGFGTTMWLAKEDGSADIVGFGFHPMEHLKVKKVGDHEPYPVIVSKWLLIRVKGVAAELELKLDPRLSPESHVVVYKGKAQVREMKWEKDVLRLETGVAELRTADGTKRLMVMGSIVAKKASEEEMRGAIDDYRKGVLPALK